MDEATEEHCLRTRWRKFIFAKGHVLSWASFVREKVASVRVGLWEVRLFDLVSGQGGNIKLRNPCKTIVKHCLELPVHELPRTKIVSDHQQILCTRKSHVKHSHSVEFSHALKRFTSARQKWPDDFFRSLGLTCVLPWVS